MMLPTFLRTILLLAATLMLGLAAPHQSLAQTATNLKCNGCVGKKDLGRKAVTKKAIGKQAVTQNAIGINAVRSRHIRNGTIRKEDLSIAARPSSAANAHTADSIAVADPVAGTVQSVSVVLNTFGNLLAFASWKLELEANDGGDCAIVLDSFQYEDVFSNGASVDYTGTLALSIPSSVTGYFTNVFPGSHNVRLICKANASDSIQVSNRDLTVLFVPGQL